MENSPKVIALLIALAAYSLQSTSDAMVKLAAGENISVHEIMFFCGVFCVFLLLGKALIQKRTSDLVPTSKKLVLIRTAFGVATNFFFFTAYSALPLANAYVVKFTAPLMIATGGALFLAERLTANVLLIIIAGFTGTYIAINPANLLSGNDIATGYAAAICGTLCFSASQLLLRKLSQNEKPEAVLFIGSCGYIVFGLFAGLWSFSIPSLAAVIFLFLASAIGLTGWFFMLSALKKATAATVSSVQYWQLIAGALLGYFIWGTVPEWNVFTGGAIIVAAGLAMARQMRKQSNVPCQR